MFYIQQNKKILLFDDDKQRLQNTIAFMPQYQGLEIKETNREIIELDNKFVFADEVQQELVEQRKQEFLKDFFKVQYNGQDLYFRKQPKGYSSAVESINTAFNIVNTIGTLPAGSLVFYQQPDFTDEIQCTKEWLVEHQVKNEQMNVTEFSTFYARFITAWNTQEHE